MESPLPFGDEIFGIWNWLDATIRIVLIVGIMTITVVYLTVGERWVLARFQMRLGPRKTGPFGILQGFADAVKLASKEDLRPARADRWVFEFAPYLTFIPVFVILIALPFAQDWGVRNLAVGVFFVFAVLGLEIVGVLMAGLGSGNKYALLGGVRAAAQMISYEIPFAITLLAVAMVIGTLDLNLIAAWQTPWGQIDAVNEAIDAGAINSAGQGVPLAVLQPLAFVIFFTALLAELHRAPFDIPVAESEIMGGYFIEYSGIRWSMFQLAEYAALWAFSIFGAVIFLGGWAFPFGEASWAGPFAFLVQIATTFVKSLALIIVMMWVRATVPRLRVDQLMSFCWKALLEVSFALLVVNALFLYYEWNIWILAGLQWLAAGLFIFIIYSRGAGRIRTANLVGKYKEVGASAT